jgi:hypothetical protein
MNVLFFKGQMKSHKENNLSLCQPWVIVRFGFNLLKIGIEKTPFMDLSSDNVCVDF